MPDGSVWLAAPWFWQATGLMAVVAALCSLVGVFLILRGLSLLTDAISHAVLPGVVAGYLLAGYMPLAFLAGAVLSGLACVSAIGTLTRRTRLKEDAAMGVVFPPMFALGIVMLSSLRGVDLDPGCVVFGEPLAAKPESLVLAGLLLVTTLAVGALAYRPLTLATFDPLQARLLGVPERFIHTALLVFVALATVVALRAVGIVLAIAFFITPGATAALLVKRLPALLGLAALLAVAEAFLGMLLAVSQNVSPSGVTASLALLVFLTVVTVQVVVARVRARLAGSLRAVPDSPAGA
ncbi:MAG: metal ABC transporter permease [Candidatus Sericytochromatia bacterium]|nr:metal ABC transporter permease [Candidatus Sericytochromatia bacterium]